jgi:hypothetical protein
MSANLGKCTSTCHRLTNQARRSRGRALIVCGDEGLRLELAFAIAHEKSTDRHRRHAAAMPKSRAAGDLDETVGSAVPETDAVAPAKRLCDP